MRGVIINGTTIKGHPVAPGDQVDVDEDTFRKLSVNGDIKPCAEIPSEGKTEKSQTKPE